MTFGQPVIGMPAGAPFNPNDQALYNAQVNYGSEYHQGMTTAVIGSVMVVIGFWKKLWWLWLSGAVVAAYGLARMSRASGVYNQAQQVYAQSMQGAPQV
jgi:hypothetical protein